GDNEPLTFEDLPTKPPLVGRPRITDEIQQAIALLVGWDETTRRILRCSPSGILYIGSPRVKAIINFQADGDGDDYQGNDIKTSEVLIKAKTDNEGDIWVNVGVAAAVDTGYPLDAGEWVNFSINNLHTLHLHFTKDDDWVNIIYSI
ncbi:unnamed protein product, partial [marine sediment metagenome]